LISAALNGKRPIFETSRRHVAACASCRRFHADAQILEQVLGGEVGGEGTVPAHLHTRIMASVREAGTETATVGLARRRGVLLSSVASVALLALVVGVAMWPQGEEREADPGVLATVLVADVDGYRRIAAQAVSGASVDVASPMETEIENLKSDISSVGEHLLACLD